MAKATKAKTEDYRLLDDEALDGKIADDELRLKKTKFSHAVNPIENPLIIKQQRRNIARLKTERAKEY